MGQLQEFLGLEKIISEKNFDMDDKLPCFKENVETKCLKGTKGRSVGKNFENDLGSVFKFRNIGVSDKQFGDKILVTQFGYQILLLLTIVNI